MTKKHFAVYHRPAHGFGFSLLVSPNNWWDFCYNPRSYEQSIDAVMRRIEKWRTMRHEVTIEISEGAKLAAGLM